MRTSYFISYPGCGQTWLHLVLGKVMDLHFDLQLPKPAGLLKKKLWDSNELVPPMSFTHDGKPYLHKVAQLRQDKSQYEGCNVIFQCRDPRDTLVSVYFKHLKRFMVIAVPKFEGSISDFLRHEVYGIEGIIAFMNIWAANRHVPARFTLVRYEDMRRNMIWQVMRVLHALDLKGVAFDDIVAAVKLGSFDNLKQMEAAGAFGSGHFLGQVNASDPDSTRARRGKVGGYIDYFSPEDVEFANEALVQLDPFFGYKEPTRGIAKPPTSAQLL